MRCWDGEDRIREVEKDTPLLYWNGSLGPGTALQIIFQLISSSWSEPERFSSGV